MIDLTYLTEEEKEMIMAVLKRDADLKSKEDQRVKELQKTSRDRNKIKYLTGEWFYETKSQRHRDRIHGSDIIRASIRQRKPVTIFELSKVWAENLTFGKIGNPDVFIPPELPGLIEEPPAQSETQSREYAGSPESQPDGLKPAVQAQAKQRQNPFNNTPLSPVSSDKTSRLVSNGAPQAEKAPAGELLPSYESPIDTLTNQTSESSETLQATLNVLKPLPRKRVLRVSQDSSTESNACKQGATPAPRSILKQNSSSSSSDSLPPHSNYSPEAEPLSPLILPDSPSLWSSFADRKQVRFSAIIRGRNPALQNGQERGDLLDQDSIALSDEEGQTDRSDTSGSSSSSNSSSSGDGSSDGLRGECESPVFSETLQRTDPELYISPKSVPQDSYSWNSKLVIHEEVKSGELLDNTDGSHQKGSNEGVALRPNGFHDCLAEPPASEVSHLHSTAPETGKSNEQRPGSPTPKLTEEEGHSIAKVLDWFSQSAGRSGRLKRTCDMEEASKDHEHARGLESKSMGEAYASESKRILKPSPKPRRGLLALFSRAEVKEACSEMITRVEDEVSYPTEDKEAAREDVQLALSKEQATSTVEKMKSKQEGLGISVVHSTSQRTLCNVKENCREPNIPTPQGAVGQEFENPTAGQNVFSDKIHKSSKVPKQEEESRPSQSDYNTLNMIDLSTGESHKAGQYIHPKHGESDLSVQPTCEGGTFPNDSISSMNYEKLQGLAQGVDGTDVHLKHKSPMHQSSVNTGKEQDTYTYIPPLKLPLSQQENKAILITNLRALWEEEKSKYNLGVTKAQVTSDIQAERRGSASSRDARKRLSASQHDLRAEVSVSHQDRGPRSSSLNRENAGHNMEITGKAGVTESKSQSQWMGDPQNQPGTLQETKKQSSSTETKSCTTNPSEVVYLNADKSNLSSQQRSQTKASPVVNLKTDKSTPRNQRKGHTKAHSPKGQSKIPRRTSYKTRLDRSPLKTFAIDIGTEKTDGHSSEDHSTTHVEHARPSSVEAQSQLEPSKRSDDKNVACFQTRRGRPEQKPPTVSTEHAQWNESSNPESPTKSANLPARQSSSGSIQVSQNSPPRLSPADAGVHKEYGSTSYHARRTASSERIGNTSKVKQQDVAKDSEAHVHLAASLDYQQYLGVPERMHVPAFFDRSRETQSQAEELPPQELLGRVSRDSSPSRDSLLGSEDLGSSRSSTPEPWSHSWASSACEL